MFECIFILKDQGGGEVVKGRVDREDEESFDKVGGFNFQGNESEDQEDEEGNSALDGVEGEEEEGGEGDEEDGNEAADPD